MDSLEALMEYPVLAVIQANQFIKKFEEIEESLCLKIEARLRLPRKEIEDLFEIELEETIKRVTTKIFI
jgi:hypothetical protein